ncbi:MAG: SPFH domain-containing protein, partial [Lachnospiraceae bacterium]|nr:SPFH domain-containing protein [Lachnospiraceae bacterium]
GRELGRRISFGGDAPGIVQRVYYMNTREITGIPFGSDAEIPFRIRDEKRNLDIDCTLLASGMYSFRICDPAKIYKQLIGNIEHVYSVHYLVSQMNSEVNMIIMKSLGAFSEESFRPSDIGNIMEELVETVKESANEKLRELRGIELVSLGFSLLRLTETDTGLIRELQKESAATDPAMAAAILNSAQAEALTIAAENPAGAGTGMIGMAVAEGNSTGAGTGMMGVAAAEGMSGDTVISDSQPEEIRPKTKVNFCPECGVKVSGGKFCRECGYKF